MNTRFSSRFLLVLTLALVGVLNGGCESTANYERLQSARTAMNAAIAAEAPGDYFIGRRFYKSDYKFWGFIRKPGQSWASAKLVMLNEHLQMAPDREINQVGSDNDYEYRLTGKFSGDQVYEPASNGFYPEFVLKSHELLSSTPATIFKTPGATDPARRIIPIPY